MVTYIKIPLAEADAIVQIEDSMLVEGLNIDKEKDIREYLIYHVIDGYSYVVKGLFDLENKNRMRPASEEELEKWDEFISNNPNWEEVDSLPVQEPEL